MVKIGISWAGKEENVINTRDIKTYIESVKAAGGIPVYLSEAESLDLAKKYLSDVDCVVIAGGEDIHPKWYGEALEPGCEEVFDRRDISDYNYVKAAIELDIPTMATCRGMQMLNVVCGGTLYQDMLTEIKTNIIHRDPKVRQFVYHTITIDDNNIIAQAMGGSGVHAVNSWHHQAVKKLGDGLRVVAKADDGTVEGIVYEKARYIYGVQFHPEFYIIDNNYDFVKMFKALIEAVE